MICVEIAKGSMSRLEARRALGEMRQKVGAEHATEVEALIETVTEPATDPSTSTGRR